MAWAVPADGSGALVCASMKLLAYIASERPARQRFQQFPCIERRDAESKSFLRWEKRGVR